MDKQDLAGMNKEEQKKRVKELVETYVPTVNEWLDEQIENAERFVGDEIDPEKQEQLDKINKLCRLLADEDDEITVPFVPRTEKSRNAMVIVHFAYPFVSLTKRTVQLMANIMSLADRFAVCPIKPASVPEDEREPENAFNDGVTDGVRLTILVENMWKTWHLE